ncbi:MAG: PrsW family intramembrane metalloprotease [Oscillospiraceae bacterium]|nr:PrsW family intramembrane metalloprotease [Oscillospiraceae bacterium]
MTFLFPLTAVAAALFLLCIGRFLIGKPFRVPWKRLFLWLLSGVLSAIPVVLIQMPIAALLANYLTPDTIPYGFVTGFLVAALIEESIKFLILLLWLRKDGMCRCTYDPVLAAAAIAGGYGMVEGVFGKTPLPPLSPVLHICFTVFMGFFLAKAKQAQLAGNTPRKVIFLILALLIPILLHGFYDFLGMSGEFPHSTAIYVLYLLALPFIAFLFVVSAVHRNVPLAPAQGSDTAAQ